MMVYLKFLGLVVTFFWVATQVSAETTCIGAKCLNSKAGASKTVDAPARSTYQTFFVENSDKTLFTKVFYQGDVTLIEVYDPQSLKLLTQWKISDFKAHSIEFSPKNPRHLLLADDHNILVYDITESGKTLLFIRPRLNINKVKQVSFGLDGEQIVWNTDTSIFITNYKTRREKEIDLKGTLKSSIQSTTALEENKIALSESNQKEIKVISKKTGEASKFLTPRSTDILTTASPDGRLLYIIDPKGHLTIWDSQNKTIKKEYTISPPTNHSVLKTVSLSKSQNKLLLVYKDKKKLIGKAVSIDALVEDDKSNKKASLSVTNAGNVYFASFFSVSPKSKIAEKKEKYRLVTPKTIDLPDLPTKSFSKKKENTLLDLATIETDNENYEKALRFIKKISTRSEDYEASRRLQRKIYDLINVQNDVNAAIEQYNGGSLKTAEILLEKALAKSPQNHQAKKYYDLIQHKQSRSLWSKVLILLMIIAIASFLAFAWFKWFFPIYKKKSKRPIETPTQDKKDKNLDRKKELAQLIFQTKEVLKQSVLRDPQNRYKNKWLEFATRITLIEKRTKLPDADIKDSIQQLIELQKSIKNIVKLKFKRDQYRSHYTHKNRTTSNDKSEKKESPSFQTSQEEKKNMGYAVLGVDKSATKEEIKKAYRKKIKQYHPDLHDASEFTWVKEEARKMTQKIQEAYEVLIDTPN